MITTNISSFINSRLCGLSMALIAAILTPSMKATTTTFTNPDFISILDNGNTWSAIDVSGLSGTLTNITVSLNGLYHEIPDDLQVILIGPNNQAITLIDFANSTDAFFSGELDLSFSDDAPNRFFSDATYPDSGLGDGFGTAITDLSYRPVGVNLRPTAIALNGFEFSSTFVGSFIENTDLVDWPNVQWKLLVRDVGEVDVGYITDGWSLTLTTSAVPEPATYGLILGVVALVGCGFRRRRQS